MYSNCRHELNEDGEFLRCPNSKRADSEPLAITVQVDRFVRLGWLQPLPLNMLPSLEPLGTECRYFGQRYLQHRTLLKLDLFIA